MEQKYNRVRATARESKNCREGIGTPPAFKTDWTLVVAKSTGAWEMAFLNFIQWPAMLITIVAVWLVASQRKSKRNWGSGFSCWVMCFGLCGVSSIVYMLLSSCRSHWRSWISEERWRISHRLWEIFGVCLVSIISEHQREVRESERLKRIGSYKKTA